MSYKDYERNPDKSRSLKRLDKNFGNEEVLKKPRRHEHQFEPRDGAWRERRRTSLERETSREPRTSGGRRASIEREVSIEQGDSGERGVSKEPKTLKEYQSSRGYGALKEFKFLNEPETSREYGTTREYRNKRKYRVEREPETSKEYEITREYETSRKYRTEREPVAWRNLETTKIYKFSSEHRDSKASKDSKEFRPSNFQYDSSSKHQGRSASSFEISSFKPTKDLTKYKQELKNFLESFANIRNPTEFWQFHEKYMRIQAKRLPHDEANRSKLLNFNFKTNIRKLYEKLPAFDRDGVKLEIPYGDFEEFAYSIKFYRDFQQKSKFIKLKKLRNGQKELPIAQFKEEIIATLEKKRVLLIAGDTGCGKSTQVPQYILEAGYKKIVCTQPRRIACISLAKRVAHETLNEFNNTVGYQIRFEKSKRAETKVTFMTEGLLLRQASEEEAINSYDVIILDEVHERHLYGDFLVGIMKCLLYKRSDFKLILMSATINLELFKNYFKKESVEVIQVPGRLYPIDIHYKPIIKDPFERKRDWFNCTPYLQIIQMIDEKYSANEKGDLLIFLNGYAEISTLASAVAEYAEARKNWIVLPLHSSLSLEEQDKVFDYPPEGVRKCIISTNVAETSITIDGVRFVIDSGKVNRMSYLTNGGINKLQETTISQDSAKQRAGRAGRTGPGVCFRLYSEEDFKSFEAFTPAEIHLVPLDSLILNMISLGLRDITNFPFLEKPSSKSIEESLEKLKFVGALSLNKESLQLTSLGEALSSLPVEITIGKMLIMSTVFGNVNSVLALAALLSVQSPLTQNSNKNPNAYELRKHLDSSHGDPISLLNYFKEWLHVKQKTSVSPKGENSKIWAKKRGLEEQRFYETTKLIEQFRTILVEANLLEKSADIELTSSERSIRHGELKQLKTLQKRLKIEAHSTQRKQLKYFAFEDGVDEKNDNNDIRDIEFRIKNDFKQLEKLLNETSSDSYKDLTILKLIVTCGLYPQVAIEDEFNSSKTVSEQLYHTKDKNFIFLRPFSYFALNAESLALHNDDIEIPPPGYFSKRPISKKHQILIYQSILETKRVYLVNVMRMPALQTLLLFAKTIATNATFTKFIFDDFLLMDAPYFGQGKTLLTRAVSLRKIWKDKLENKLKNSDSKNEEEIFYFIEDLIKFTRSEVSYNIKRLLPADIKTVYTSSWEFYEPPELKDKRNPFDKDEITTNKIQGGYQLTENVVYNCLVQEEWEINIEEEILGNPFECSHCNKTKLGYDVLRILQHESFCKMKNVKELEKTQSDNPIIIKANSKLYRCDKCEKELHLTPVEILKHKKACS